MSDVALVTGASRGIGQSVALSLARAGFTVVGTATSSTGAEKISASFIEAGHPGQGMVLDVRDAKSVENVVHDIESRFATVMVLVNNAGITRDGLLMQMTDDRWHEVLDADLGGVFRLCRQVIRPMLKARRGRIINIGSVVARMGNPGQINYASAKAGLEGLTRALAREVGSRNITVNCVAPGFVETDMTKELSEDIKKQLIEMIPLKRLGKVKDVADLVTFLASPAADYITGAVLPVNGGLSMI